MALKNNFDAALATGQDVTMRSSDYAPSGNKVGDVLEVNIVATHEYEGLTSWAAINYPLYYVNTVTSGANANDYLSNFLVNSAVVASISKKISYGTSESNREARGFRANRTTELTVTCPITGLVSPPTASHNGGPFAAAFTLTVTRAAGCDYLLVAKRDLNGILANTGGTTNHFTNSNFSGPISGPCVVLIANGVGTDPEKWNGRILIFWNNT